MRPDGHSTWLTLSSLPLFHGWAAAEINDLPTWALSEDSTFNVDVLGELGQSVYSGGGISAILRVAEQLEPGNFTSFTNACYGLANETKVQGASRGAQKCLRSGECERDLVSHSTILPPCRQLPA
jgi:hypothetical protein